MLEISNLPSSINFFPGMEKRVYFQNPETNEFWFHATSVCEVLGYKNVTSALGLHCDDDEKFQEIWNGKATWFVSEAGCYGLAMGAKTDAAKKFKRWLKHDVLPKLRAEGTYTIPTKTLQLVESQRKQICGLKHEVYLLSQDSCYRQLVKAFIRDNLAFSPGKFVLQSDYTKRFWKWVETDAAMVWKPKSIDDMNNRELIQEMSQVLAEVKRSPDSKMFMSKDNHYGDIENAKLIPINKADSAKISPFRPNEILVKELMAEYGQ